MEWLRRLAMGFSLAAIAGACVSAWSAQQDAAPHVASASEGAVTVAQCAAKANAR